ncbi:MAG: hypothetical protein ABR962_03585 [Candidatus Bathyarchaeia archaeon]|jgi:uncharacterized membrane protein
MEAQPQYDKYCEHCRRNPNGKKPYERMTTITLDKNIRKIAQKEADRLDQDLSCMLCKDVLAIINAQK